MVYWLRHDWSVSTGAHGRWFHRYLDQSTWRMYERTFAGVDIEENWRALFATLDLVRMLGKEIATALGFEYPEGTDGLVTGYIRWIRQELGQ